MILIPVSGYYFTSSYSASVIFSAPGCAVLADASGVGPPG
jgi:hypothetical protein